MVTLTQAQEIMLSRHAAARNQTPAQALDTLLSAPTPQRRPWTEEELNLLRNPKNTPKSIALRTGRSVQAISVRRHALAKDENRSELMRPRPNEDSARRKQDRRNTIYLYDSADHILAVLSGEDLFRIPKDSFHHLDVHVSDNRPAAVAHLDAEIDRLQPPYTADTLPGPPPA